MNYYLYIIQAAPALYWILADARTATSERDRRDLRYRIRLLGLSPADTQIALGLLADSLGEGRVAA